MFRILLIDDEPMIKIGVRKLLEDTDYIIAGTANNGMEALEYLKTNSVDIIMTDLKMPVMNGLELIHQLNALSFDGAILVLSNYSDFELVREALTAGALDYILKTDMTRSRLLKYLDKISQSLCLQRKKQVEAAEQALQQEQNSQKLLFAEMERALLTDGALSADVQNFLTNSRGSEARHGMMLIDLSGAQAQHQKPLLRQFQSILPEILSGAGTIQTIQPQQDQLLCPQGHSDPGRGGVGVDVVGVAVHTGRHGRDHGDVALGRQVLDDLRVHVDDLSNITEILGGRQLFRAEQIAVHAAQSDGAPAVALEQLHQILIDLARENHLHDIHGLLVGIAQTVDKAAFLARLFQHGADLRPAAVHQHNVDADQLHEHDIAHDRLLQFFIDHSVAAVLDYDGLSIILLDIRQSLYQHLRAIRVCDIHGCSLSLPSPRLRCGNRR